MQKPATALVTALLPLCTAQEPAAPSRELAEVAAAYAAKVAASALFVSGRTLDSVLAEELAPTRPLEARIRPLLRFDVDREQGTVTCRLGPATATAAATGDLGCTLVRPEAPRERLRARRGAMLADLQPDPAAVDWPLGDRLPPPPETGIDLAAVRRAVDAAFAEPATGTPILTRAIAVVYRGQLVAERYAAGYHAAMPLPGWSMTKTLTHALLGVRIQEGKLDPTAALAVPEWRSDERRAIGFDDLLTMTAGLSWREDYADPSSDALRMLFTSSDHAAAYANRPVANPPGTTFLYASGATNLLCRLLRATFADDRDYWSFPRRGLFQPLGMRSALLETDPSGTFVGSSYGFATLRDWARFGLLYANDGKVGDTRILPPGWVTAATTPHPRSRGRFGRHLWLDHAPEAPGKREWPDLPADLFYMSGHEGQYCIVMPTDQLLVVRLGCTKNGGFPLHALLTAVHNALRP